MELADTLKQQARQLGFAAVGIASADGSERLQLRSAALERWLDAGHQADMAWMADPRRRNVEALLPGVRSVVAVGLPYYVDAERAPGSLKVARYGWGRDYHRVIDGRLRALGRWLEGQSPGVGWRACVDSAPLLDKAWAEEAGLGWIGKHSNLISREHGSWLLIGHLLTTAELPADPPAMPACGTCTACLDACPTGASANRLWWMPAAASPFTRSKTAMRNCPRPSPAPWRAGWPAATSARTCAPGITNPWPAARIPTYSRGPGG